MKVTNLRRRAILATAVAGMGIGTVAQASTYTWANLTGSWFADAAWSGQSWTNNSDALFAVTGLPAITVDQPVIATSITNSTASTITFSGANAVSIGAGGISGTVSNNLVFNNPLTIGASQTWNKLGSVVVNGLTTFTDGTTLTLRQGNSAFSNPSNTGSGTIVAGGGSVANETLQAAGTGNMFGTGVISLRSQGRISGNDAVNARTIPNAVILENTGSGASAGMIGGQNNTGALIFLGGLTVNGNGSIQSDCGGVSSANRGQSVTFAGTTTLKGTLSVFTQNNTTNINTTTFSGPIVDDTSARNFTKTSGGSGAGGLVVFSGTNTYRGTTTISGGTLALQSADLTNNIANSATINLSQGTASLDVTGIVPGFSVASGQMLTGVGKVWGNVTVGAGASIAAGSITATNGINLQNNLALAGGGTLTYDQNRIVNVTGNLALTDGGTTTVSVPNLAALTPNTYTLINYNGTTSGTGTFAINTVPNTRANPSIDATQPNKVNLVIAGSAANLVWAGDGIGNQWDVNTTPDWSNGGSSDSFFNLDAVTFDDTTTNNTVNINTTVQPKSVTVSGASNYIIAGTGGITSTGGISVNFNSTANTTIGNSNSFAGTISFNSGTVTLTNADALSQHTRFKFNGGSAVLNPGLGKSVIAFPLEWVSGKLDINDNLFIADYQSVPSTTLSTVATQVQAAYNGGAWDGASGISSSLAKTIAADNNNTHKTGIGFGEASSLGITSFGGQATDLTMVLMRYTYLGDANLDGTVNALDFNAIAGGFGAGGKSWINGDFNYDGNVDSADFAMLSTNYNLTLAAPALGALVPEPMSISLLAFAAMGLLARRRR